jgi:hypothetical protein
VKPLDQRIRRFALVSTDTWGSLVVATAGAIAGFFPLQNTDIGHHVATGRWIVEHGTVPTTDPFSWTAFGAPWYLYQWLPDLLWYEAAQWDSTGLIVLRMAVFSGLAALFFLAARARGASWSASLAAALLCVGLIRPRMLMRPMILGYAGLALLDVLLTRLEQHQRHGTRIMAHVTMMVWAAVHPLFVWGLVRWFQHSLVVSLRDPLRRHQWLSWALAVASCGLVVGVVMPTGLDALWSVVLAGQDPLFANVIVELKPFVTLYPVTGVHLFALGLATIGFWRCREPWTVRLVRLAWLLLVGTVAMLHARSFAELVVVVCPWLAVGLSEIEVWLRERRQERRARLFRWAMPGYAAVLLVVALGTSELGWGFARATNQYPPAVGALLRQNPPQRLYHDMLFGGFILWDLYGEVRPFVDGRLEVYGSAFLRDPYSRIFSAGRRWEQTLDALGVDAILLSPDRYPRLHAALAHHPHWELAFADPYSMLYRRH